MKLMNVYIKNIIIAKCCGGSKYIQPYIRKRAICSFKYPYNNNNEIIN